MSWELAMKFWCGVAFKGRGWVFDREVVETPLDTVSLCHKLDDVSEHLNLNGSLTILECFSRDEEKTQGTQGMGT